jgi:G:T-mismatch repair DNA endonuclease (very short patch repair protein)
MKLADGTFEYWIDKYTYNSQRKRRQFRKLLNKGKVTRVKPEDYPEYDLRRHWVYHSPVSIQIVRG